MELDYVACKQMVVDALKNCIALHEERRYSELTAVYETLDMGLPRGGGPESRPFFIALNFLDGWVDDSNHYWQMYDGIEEDDWPKLARELIDDLTAGRDISNKLVLDYFDLKRGNIAPMMIGLLYSVMLILIVGPFILFWRFVQLVRGFFGKKR